MRPGPFFALAAFAVASPVLAEPLAPTLVRLLDAPGRPHPLADRSGRVAVTAALPPGADAASLGLLQVAPGIGAVRLTPGEVGPFAAAHPGLPLSVVPPLRPLLDVSDTWTQVGGFRETVAPMGKGKGKGVIVGVVDTGVDIRHPDFRDANGKTRVAWMLAGGAPKGLHPELEKKFGCTDSKQAGCAVYAAADIDAMLESGADELLDREGHGTHVTSIAAGNGGPTVNSKPRFIGMAPEATLIIGAPSENGGFFDADILNATRFIFDRADEMMLPAAVNLSLGGDYGSHDGKSALEVGLSALVGDDKPGRVIVVASGNSGAFEDRSDGKGPYGIHTEVHVSADEVTRVPIATKLTAKGQGFVWITFRPGDDVEVALEGPKGAQWVGFTGKSDQGGYTDGTGPEANQGGVVNNLPKANPALTAETNSAIVVFTGHWGEGTEFAVQMRGSGDASLWVTGQGDAAQALFFERAIRQGTVNVPASAPGLLAVGCTINRITWKPFAGAAIALSQLGPDLSPVPDGACHFSADGPTPFGVQKPEISAPGGFVAAAMSADADPRLQPGGLFDLGGCPTGEPFCAVMDDQHALATGTSMSAPHVTGAVALLLELDPSLTQARVTEVLQAGARRPHGHVPDAEQLGPGELDMEGALEALLNAQGEVAEPDLAKSWYTISSAYARPDPTWPVWGTIELRKSDGKLAGAIDGTKLALSTRGGTVYQSLVKVRQGMWRFAVAGRPEDVGTDIDLDVTYGGVSLGAVKIPVGTDVWRSSDLTFGAVGGCAWASGTTGGAGAAALAGLAAAAVVARRRRRAARQPAR